MSNSSYHHGDLKNALIEAGIEMINEVGEEKLSLRKVAARCGVSNAAPYAHFSGKEEMIEEMQNYVTEKFMDSLKSAASQCENPYSEESVLKIGRAYILFFLQNPQYFSFLFAQPCMKAHLSLDDDGKDDFPPYQYFKEVLLEYDKYNEQNLTKDEQEIQIIHLWATVHGISAIATMKNVTWDKKWEEQLQILLR
ncbi:MAG TPA: TetR/AcrR family transcriptional regulator [Lachnospiraceae bacterium]|nr:TetR/AcrR family transcriptional regulator [Lachnospiraceae bacterium]